MTQQGKYSESDVEQQAPIAPPVEDRGLAEAGKQLLATGKGLAKSLKTTLPGLINPGLGVLSAAKQFPGLVEAVKAPLRELGGMTQPGKSVLTAPTNIPERLEGALSSALGGDPAAARANFMAGKPREGFADLYTVPATTLALGGLLKKAIPTTMASDAERANLLTKASGATEGAAVDFPKEFSVALPELDKTIQEPRILKDGTQVPRTPVSQMRMPEFLDLTQDTFNRIENNFRNYLAPLANREIIPEGLLQELRALKKSHSKSSNFKEWNDAIDRKITEYSKPYSYGELNEERMAARDRINTYYQKNPSAQGAALGSNVDTAIDEAINQGTKNIIYDTLEREYKGRVPEGYFRNLKRTESALYNIKDQVSKQQKYLSNQGAKGVWDRARIHEYVSSRGHIGGAVGGIGEMVNPVTKSAPRAIRSAFSPQRSVVPPLPIIGGTAGRRAEPSLAPDDEQ